MCDVRLTLVSASPRRRELLTLLGYPFDVSPTSTPETWSGSDATGIAESNARAKLERSSDYGDRSRLLVGADTLIEFGGQLLGKPLNESSARRMLMLLSGRQHRVITGVCIAGPSADDSSGIRQASDSAESLVRFLPLSTPAIEAYLSGREWVGKAGGYGIQGEARKFAAVDRGELNTVIGLPLQLVDGLLRTHFHHCRLR